MPRVSYQCYHAGTLKAHGQERFIAGSSLHFKSMQGQTLTWFKCLLPVVDFDTLTPFITWPAAWPITFLPLSSLSCIRALKCQLAIVICCHLVSFFCLGVHYKPVTSVTQSVIQCGELFSWVMLFLYITSLLDAPGVNTVSLSLSLAIWTESKLLTWISLSWVDLIASYNKRIARSTCLVGPYTLISHTCSHLASEFK